MVILSLRKLYDSPFKVTHHSSQKEDRGVKEEDQFELCVDLSRVFHSCEKTIIMQEGVAGQKTTFETDEVLEGSEEDLYQFGQTLKRDKNLYCRGYKLTGMRISLPLKKEDKTELDHQGNCGMVSLVHDGEQQMIAKSVLLDNWRYAELAVPVTYQLWLKQQESQTAGLVKILAIYVDGPLVVTLQEYAGKNLEESFFDGPVDELTLRSVMKQGLYTLHQLEQMNISLGDIKPENMAEEGGLVRFVDYGSASLAVDMNFGRGLSLAYKAPEYLKDAYPRLSPSGDVFSFAVTVLSLAIGEHVWITYGESERWEEEIWKEKLMAQIKESPQSILELLPESWGPALHRLLLKMLTVQPGSRITAKQALEDEYFKEGEVQNVFDPTDMLVPASPDGDLASLEFGQGDATVLGEAEELVLAGHVTSLASHVTSRGVNRSVLTTRTQECERNLLNLEETDGTGTVEVESNDTEPQQHDPVQVPCDLATFWFEVPDSITGKVFISTSKFPLDFSVKWAEGCHISGEFTIPKSSRVTYRKDFPDGTFYNTTFKLKGDTHTEAWFLDHQRTHVPRVLHLMPPDTSRLACKLYVHQSITVQVAHRPSREVQQIQLDSPISGHFDICVL